MNNKWKIVTIICSILAIISAIVFVLLQFGLIGEKDAGKQLPPMADTSQDVVTLTAEPLAENPEPTPTVAPTPTPTEAPTPEPTPILEENPYKEYFAANKDMVAWLVVPDTKVDYPLMWTPKDENYYLLRGFDGSSDKNGCLILDTDSSIEPGTTNLIVHGHNMKSGAMFGELTKYEDANYAAEHSKMYVHTPTTVREYEVIAAFRSQVYKKSDNVFKFYKFFEATSEEEFLDFYNNIKEMSIYDTGVSASYGDRFLTLSTCTYHVENGRFVVVAKEVSEEEKYFPLAE